MSKAIFTTLEDGTRIWCEFICRFQRTNDYRIGGSFTPIRASVSDDGTFQCLSAFTVGLTEDQCRTAVKNYLDAEQAEYLQWHEANKAKYELGEPKSQAVSL